MMHEPFLADPPNGRATHLPRIATDHNANIVVMGALARNRATSPDIGSTAESVFESLPCDVLVIKSLLAP